MPDGRYSRLGKRGVSITAASYCPPFLPVCARHIVACRASAASFIGTVPEESNTELSTIIGLADRQTASCARGSLSLL